MFTNIIKPDRNRVRLELSNRDPAVSALPCFTVSLPQNTLHSEKLFFSSISLTAFSPVLEFYSSIEFCSWWRRNCYLDLNPGRKIWDDRSFGKFCGGKFVRDTWQRPEYFIRGRLCVTRRHRYFIFGRRRHLAQIWIFKNWWHMPSMACRMNISSLNVIMNDLPWVKLFKTQRSN